MPDTNKIIALKDIATDILVAELKRRAEVKQLSIDALIYDAGRNWTEAADKAEQLINIGHETE